MRTREGGNLPLASDRLSSLLDVS